MLAGCSYPRSFLARNPAFLSIFHGSFCTKKQQGLGCFWLVQGGAFQGHVGHYDHIQRNTPDPSELSSLHLLPQFEVFVPFGTCLLNFQTFYHLPGPYGSLLSSRFSRMLFNLETSVSSLCFLPSKSVTVSPSNGASASFLLLSILLSTESL